MFDNDEWSTNQPETASDVNWNPVDEEPEVCRNRCEGILRQSWREGRATSGAVAKSEFPQQSAATRDSTEQFSCWYHCLVRAYVSIHPWSTYVYLPRCIHLPTYVYPSTYLCIHRFIAYLNTRGHLWHGNLIANLVSLWTVGAVFWFPHAP